MESDGLPSITQEYRSTPFGQSWTPHYISTNTLSTPVSAARSNAFKASPNLNSSAIKTIGSTCRDSNNRNAGSKGPQREPMILISSTTMDEKLTLISPL